MFPNFRFRYLSETEKKNSLETFTIMYLKMLFFNCGAPSIGVGGREEIQL